MLSLPKFSSLQEAEISKCPAVRYIVENIFQYLKTLSQMEYMTRMATTKNLLISLPATVYLQQVSVTVNFSFQPVVIEDLPVPNVPQSVQEVQQVPQFQQPQNHIPKIMPPKTLYDALLLIQSAIVYNWGLINWSNAVFNKERQVAQIVEVFTENELKKLKKLKSALISYQVLLDELYYACAVRGFESKMPELELLKTEKENVLHIIKHMKVAKRLKLLPRTMFFDDDHILCAIFGLKLSFVDYMKSLDPILRSHEPLIYWIKHFLSQVAASDDEDMSLRKSFIPDIEILENMQFTNSRAFVIKQWIETHEFYHSQNILYWVKQYIDDIYMHDILLNNAPRYPWDSKIDEWNLKPIPTDGRTDKENVEANINIRFINTSNYKYLFCADNSTRFPPEADDSHNVFFHGTSHEYALNIIENGIDISRGQEAQDFSNGKGFYVGYNFEDAVKWAKKCSRPAVIVFKTPIKLLEEFDGYDLTEKEEELWQKIVFYNRKGCQVKFRKSFDYKDYSKQNYIIGPMCRNPAEIKSEVKEVKGYGRKDALQLCITSEDLADKFGDLLLVHSVIFL